MKKLLIGLTAALAIAGAAGTAACGPTNTPSSAPRNSDTKPSASAAQAQPKVARTPVELSGTGETVKTVELQKGGYTVKYHAGGTALIVQPVNPDGSDSFAWMVNALSPNINGPVDGTTTIKATGPATVHVSNVNGEDWSLTFTPLG